MPVNFLQRRKILKNINYLELTPYRLYSDEIDEKGIVTILVPKFTNPIAKRLLESTLKSKFIKIKLDELGSEAWKNTDGKKKVYEIANILGKAFGEKVKPVDERLTKFYTGLYLQNIISFNEIKKQGE